MPLDSLAWPDRFLPFLFVVAFFSATTNKNGKKRSGHATGLLKFVCASKTCRPMRHNK